MKKWTNLIESDENTERLRRRAMATGDEKDWDNYEGRLIRQGDLPRALDRLAERASMERMDLVRRLLEKAKGLPAGKVVMLTGMMRAWMGSTPQVGQPPATDMPRRDNWLVLAVTGGNLRVSYMRSQTLTATRWSPPYLFPKQEVDNIRFYIADMRPGHLPKDYGNR